MPRIRTPNRVGRGGPRRQRIDLVVIPTKKQYCSTPEQIEGLIGTALELRLQGHTYESIARIIGYSFTRAYQFVQMGLGKRADITTKLAGRLRKQALERLDRIYEAHADRVGCAKSAVVLLKTLERQAKLVGIDAPDAIIFPPAPVEQQYDLSKPSIDEQRALRDLLLKSAVVVEATTTQDDFRSDVVGGQADATQDFALVAAVKSST